MAKQRKERRRNPDGRFFSEDPELRNEEGHFQKGKSGNPAGRWVNRTRDPRDEHGRFEPGGVPNPKGRGAGAVKIFSNLATEARQYANKALATLVDLLEPQYPPNGRELGGRPGTTNQSAR
jgi:hypothetical protein